MQRDRLRRTARKRRRRLRRLGLVSVAGLAGTTLAVFALGKPGPSRATASSVSHVVTLRRAPAPALPGALLIADRGNNRLLLVNQAHHILWSFPNARDIRAGRTLRFNDDSFVAAGGKAIVSNEEESHTIVAITIATHALTHLYGVPGTRGSSLGYLNTPDDAYPLPNGDIMVADAYNCRILWIRGRRIIRQIGKTAVCTHNPPTTLGAVNGDTPLLGGGLLVSEIPGHFVDHFAANGRLLWSASAPVSYPSDPQPLPNGNVLLADYTRPGAVVIMDRFGHTLWRYAPTSGPGELDHPSLAAMLPNGFIAINDDFRDRVVILNPATKEIVWQYGLSGVAGTGRNRLNTPDGMDFVPLSPGGRPEWANVHHPAAPIAPALGRALASG